MKDSYIKKTGNSRYLKSAISADITHEQLVAMLIAGTLPIDLNGINPEGWQQIGDALCKKNLLDDVTCDLLGLPRTAVPNDAFRQLLMPSGYHAYAVTVTVNGKPLANTLIKGIKTFNNTNAYTDSHGYVLGMAQGDSVSLSTETYLDIEYYSRTFRHGPNVITPITMSLSWYSGQRRKITTSTTGKFSNAVSAYDLFLVGAGGSGALVAENDRDRGSGGGGGGYTTTISNITNNADVLSITIGQGGIRKYTNLTHDDYDDGLNGGTTSVAIASKNLNYSAAGGKGGETGITHAHGGNGGSGGGGVRDKYAYAGGSNGSDGSNGADTFRGKGQGTTTRGFFGVLYSGGGGAAIYRDDDVGGSGGGGEGQGGSLSTDSAIKKANATDYGGGGGGIAYDTNGHTVNFESKGYQGIVEIRWR